MSAQTIRKLYQVMRSSECYKHIKEIPLKNAVSKIRQETHADTKAPSLLHEALS